MATFPRPDHLSGTFLIQDVEMSTSLTESARRETVQELENRVQSLESAALASSVTSQIQPTGYQSFVSSPWNDQRPYNPSEDPTWNNSKSSTSSSVPLTRGTTSPWTTLLAGTASADIPSFHDSASQISGQETWMSLSVTGMHYDILRELPNIREDQVHVFIRNYGTIAPYPILHYESLVGVVRQILDQRQASRSGQIACVFVVSSADSTPVQEYCVADYSTPEVVYGFWLRSFCGFASQHGKQRVERLLPEGMGFAS